MTDQIGSDKKIYKTGMYGGKFLPFHKGHNFCVQTAARECERVFVILFWGCADEEIIRKNDPGLWLSVEERTKKLYQICESAGRLAEIIPALIDLRELRLPDGSEDWDAETPLVRDLLGYPLDAVYSSEESYGEYFSRAYPEAVHRLVDVRRVNFPISGTEIRKMNGKEERAKWVI